MVKALPLKKRYKYLTVLAGKVGRCVRCRCDCGNEILVRPPSLVHGKRISCGCRFNETRHRKSDPDTAYAEYFIWAGMKRRCCDPKRPEYPRYGGRGIGICREWLVGDGGLNGFRCFLRDMGKRPTPEHSLERRDNDGPYSKENCVWGSRSQQASNQQRIRTYAYRGVVGTVASLARQFGKDAKNVRQRMNALGWSFEEAMDRPTIPKYGPRS